MPFAFHVDPRASIGRVYRSGQGGNGAQQPGIDRKPRAEQENVTDVEEKGPRSKPGQSG